METKSAQELIESGAPAKEIRAALRAEQDVLRRAKGNHRKEIAELDRAILVSYEGEFGD